MYEGKNKKEPCESEIKEMRKLRPRENVGREVT
jgi:hypothetical protein